MPSPSLDFINDYVGQQVTAIVEGPGGLIRSRVHGTLVSGSSTYLDAAHLTTDDGDTYTIRPARCLGIIPDPPE